MDQPAVRRAAVLFERASQRGQCDASTHVCGGTGVKGVERAGISHAESSGSIPPLIDA